MFLVLRTQWLPLSSIVVIALFLIRKPPTISSLLADRALLLLFNRPLVASSGKGIIPCANLLTEEASETALLCWQCVIYFCGLPHLSRTANPPALLRSDVPSILLVGYPRYGIASVHLLCASSAPLASLFRLKKNCYTCRSPDVVHLKPKNRSDPSRKDRV